MPAFPPGFELWPAEVINPPPPPIAAAAPLPPQNAPPLLLALPEDYVDAMSWDSWEDTDNGETKESLTTADDLDLFCHEVLPFSDDEDEDPDFDDWGIEDGEAEEKTPCSRMTMAIKKRTTTSWTTTTPRTRDPPWISPKARTPTTKS